jgi:MFS transporter, DHA1 family, tetracycline resistance protein
MGIGSAVDTLCRLAGDVLSREPGERRQRLTFAVVFTTILIDFVGFSLLIPVLPLFADRLGASSLQVGWIVALYGFFQLLFLPFWGWVSDRVGRRPVILISLLGTAVSFAVLATAQSIGVVYLARALTGLFAASIGAAQAVVTDLTPPTERASGMGLIGAAFGGSLVVGPAAGGMLAALHEQAPFYAIVILAGANFLLAWVALPESRPENLPRPPWRDLARTLVPTPLRLFARVHDRRIALFLVLFFVFFAAFAVVEAMGTLYLYKRFYVNELRAALVFAWIGLFMVATQAGPLRRLVGWVGEVRLLVIGFALMAVGIAAVAWVPSYPWFFAIGPIIAIGNGLGFPSFTSLFTKACRAEEAGELLGQSNSMGVAGRIVGAVGGGALMSEHFLAAPFLASSALLVLGLVLFLALRPLLLRDVEPAA